MDVEAMVRAFDGILVWERGGKKFNLWGLTNTIFALIQVLWEANLQC